ncbi:hypothetical protein E2P64_00370 [Candidatus Bathyarchaeota archaeon]|nr:hypothetical protein E2P64_00370 [Candidatus Bathyarchaeota archaeon]
MISPTFAKLSWWDSNWDYRVCLEVNASKYSREDWPVEFPLNLTYELNYTGGGGAVNVSSLRLIEQDTTSGDALFEVASQFDQDAGFDAVNNFYGLFVFIMNGTLNANQVRTYCIYYDTDAKPAGNYTNISYYWDGEELQVNVTIEDSGTTKGLEYWIDSSRGANVSGIYRISDYADNEFWTAPSQSENPIEYMQYSNGTYNFTFDLQNNMTVVYEGPTRLVVEQTGPEVVWNSTNQAEGEITKRYTFYHQNQWIKVDQIYRNTADYNITRNSTAAGALTVEVGKIAFNNIILGNASEPASWFWFAAEFANFHAGIINVNDSGPFATVNENTTWGKGGIELSNVTIQPNETLYETAALHFNSPSAIKGSPTDAQVRNLRNRLLFPENTTKTLSEKWAVSINASTDFAEYNRGENVSVLVNATVDSGLISLVNASMASTGGNTTLVLYDDGSHGDSQPGDDIYTNYFILSETNSTGQWNVSSYAWTNESVLLNVSSTSFQVFDVYPSTLNISNDYGFVNRSINATMDVMNYRNDTYIAGATITCEYDSTDANPNVTDYGNGSYLVEFAAPDYYGLFTLTCNATKLGNNGPAQDMFIAVTYVTEVMTELGYTGGLSSVGNVTLSHGQNFTMLANVTNLGNGTAFDVNISLYEPANWTINATFEQSGNINLFNSYLLYVDVGAPANETAGFYLLNATIEWGNADNTTDTYNATFNITVDQNPTLYVPEENLSTTAASGAWNHLGNITVMSEGNVELVNVTFNVTGIPTMTFNFTPSNISSLFQGDNTVVEVWVYAPSDHALGIFNGTLNASSANSAHDLVNISIGLIETFMHINATPSFMTSDQTRWYEFQNFTFTINTTNVGTSPALDTNITIVLPEANWITNVTNNRYNCSDIPVGGSCFRTFELAVKMSTPENYTVFANVTWMNPGVGMTYNTTNITVEVLSNKEFQIDDWYVAGSAPQGQSTDVGVFTVRNTGNDQINGVGANVTNLDDFNISFNPIINFIPAGSVINVTAKVNVSAGYPAGNYTGTINYTSADDGYDWLYLNVTVPEDKTWQMYPVNCTTEVAFDEGKMCDVQINNTGNAEINFTIYVIYANYTYANDTSFSIPLQGNHTFSIWWNLTGQQRDYYNETFNVSTVNANPAWRYLNMSMIPRELAEINASISANMTQELQPVTIYANVTDKSGQGINYARVIVFLPDNTTEARQMTLVNQSNVTYWYMLVYPGVWGSNDVYGNYTVGIEVLDNLGLYSRENMSLYVWPILDISADTGFSTYYAGETASMYINTTDYSGWLIPANVSVKLRDSLGNLRYDENFTSPGTVSPIPLFTIASDAPFGNYTIYIDATHYDPFANETVNHSTTHQFDVREEYNVEFDVGYVWYASQPILAHFYVLVYTDRDLVDPDSVTLNVFDSAENLYFTNSSLRIFNVTSNSKLYQASHTLPTTTGYYLAELIVRAGDRHVRKLKSFRVSFGGPYDVDIIAIDSEVEQGDDLDFTILLENYGDQGQDVYLSYWVEDSDNDTYAYVYNRPTFVDAGGNRTIDANLSIYSNQTAGDYALHVLLNYSPLYPPLEVLRGFRVVEAEVPEEEPEIIEPVVAAVIELTITNLFPDELILNRGAIGYLTIEIKNTGNVDLSDITAFFEDIDKAWFEVVREADSLSPGSSGYLVVKFTIPEDAAARTYVSKMRIISREVEVSEFYKLIVFKTQEEALRARIASLREELLDLEDQTGKVAARGGDVTKILSLLRKARELLDVAETFLEEDSTVDAIKTISEVETVIEEIKYRLEISKPDYLPSITLPEIPSNWYVIAISLAALILLVIIAITKFNLLRRGERRKVMRRLRSAVKRKREVEQSSDIFDTLKGHYEEGMISRETFQELKKILK